MKKPQQGEHEEASGRRYGVSLPLDLPAVFLKNRKKPKTYVPQKFTYPRGPQERRACIPDRIRNFRGLDTDGDWTLAGTGH